MQELFDGIAAELKAEFIAFKAEKSKSAKLHGLATIAALAGSLRTVVAIAEDGELSNPEITENADKVVAWCISQCK